MNFKNDFELVKAFAMDPPSPDIPRYHMYLADDIISAMQARARIISDLAWEQGKMYFMPLDTLEQCRKAYSVLNCHIMRSWNAMREFMCDVTKNYGFSDDELADMIGNKAFPLIDGEWALFV